MEIIERKKISLDDIKITMEIHSELLNGFAEEIDKNDMVDYVSGKILYDDPDIIFNETGDHSTEEIGTFSFKIIRGSVDNIYHFFEYVTSKSETDYMSEIFIVKETRNNIIINIRKEYDHFFWDDHGKFIIFDRIMIKENFRGYGIINKVFDNIIRIFGGDIILKPFPLQHEGDIDYTTYKSDLKKVTDVYLKCGFKRVRKKSEFLMISEYI